MKILSNVAAILLLNTILMGFMAPAWANQPAEAVYPDTIPTMQGNPESNQWRVMGPQREHYNLHVTSSARNGGFTIDDHLIIKNLKGKILLDVKNVDPVFFAQLPSGHYVMTATSGNEKKTKRISVSASKATDVNFVW